MYCENYMGYRNLLDFDLKPCISNMANSVDQEVNVTVVNHTC